MLGNILERDSKIINTALAVDDRGTQQQYKVVKVVESPPEPEHAILIFEEHQVAGPPGGIIEDFLCIQ